MLPLLFMIPFLDTPTGAPIDRTVPAHEYVIEAPSASVEIGDAATLTKPSATYNGEPIEISNGVTLTMTDGFTVTMSAEDADFALNPPMETDEEYNLRLCLQYAEAKPWLEVACQ